MAGIIANTAGLYSSMGMPLAKIKGSRYPWGQVMPFDSFVGPTESNWSDAYIGNIMSDPRDSPSVEEFLDTGGVIKMPCRKRFTIHAKVNSITRGFPTFPDFED